MQEISTACSWMTSRVVDTLLRHSAAARKREVLERNSVRSDRHRAPEMAVYMATYQGTCPSVIAIELDCYVYVEILRMYIRIEQYIEGCSCLRRYREFPVSATEMPRVYPHQPVSSPSHLPVSLSLLTFSSNCLLLALTAKRSLV
jgi:hypothetical protein